MPRPAFNIMVTGGCGYIGSHMVKLLLAAGYQVVVLDDLSGGFQDSLPGGRLVVGDYGDRALLDQLLVADRFDGVLHFASLIQAGESVRQPGRYYANNVTKSLVLLEALRDHGVGPVVFSSSAAVYGEPQKVPIDERHPLAPLTPYGAGKLMVERMLEDFERAHGLPWLALRYFNAAGADPDGLLGECHVPETHLIPLALRAGLGQGPPLRLFGRDYDTPDGTCIRDYVHVVDLAAAHLSALEYLRRGGRSGAFNLGSGSGFSVRRVLAMVERLTGAPVPVEEAPRRPGDPACLVADAGRARAVLGWTPRYPDLQTMVEHALAWEQGRSTRTMARA